MTAARPQCPLLHQGAASTSGLTAAIRPVAATLPVDYPLECLLVKAAAGAFAPVETRYVGSGLSAAANFVRVPIISLDDQPQRGVLATNRALGYSFKVHLVLNDGSDSEPLLFEFNSAAGQWTDEDVHLHTELVMPPQSSGYLYVVYESLNGVSPMTIETTAGEAAKRTAQDLIFAAVVGLTQGWWRSLLR